MNSIKLKATIWATKMSILGGERGFSLEESIESPPEYGYWPNATLKLFVTEKCNLNCCGCFNRPFLRSATRTQGVQSLTKNQIVTCMDSARKTFNTHAVEFSGGEPTLRPDLPELISHAKSIGFTTRIVTNGSILGAFGAQKEQFDRLLSPELASTSAEERIAILIKSGLDRFSISVDNMHTIPDEESTPNTSNFPKVPVSFVINAIKILLDNRKWVPKNRTEGNILDRSRININMTASGKDYPPSLLLVKRVMEGAGAKPILSVGEKLPKTWVTDDGQEIRLYRNETAAIGRGINMDLTHFKSLEDIFSRNCFDFVPRSLSPVGSGINQEIAVNYDGQVYNCAMQSFPLGDIKTHSLPQIVEYVNLGTPPDKYKIGATMFIEIMHIVEETKGQKGWGEAYRRILEMDPSLKPSIIKLRSHGGACYALGHNPGFLKLLQLYRVKHQIP